MNVNLGSKLRTFEKLKSSMLPDIKEHAVVQPTSWFSNQTQTSMNGNLESISNNKKYFKSCMLLGAKVHAVVQLASWFSDQI
jgi:hypothetical protein